MISCAKTIILQARVEKDGTMTDFGRAEILSESKRFIYLDDFTKYQPDYSLNNIAIIMSEMIHSITFYYVSFIGYDC